MKKNTARYFAILLPGMLASCTLFEPVDPLPPIVFNTTIDEITRTELTITGTISNPGYKNARQKKKSGDIVEYGIIYSTSPNPSIESGQVIKLGSRTTSPVVSIFSEKITGLKANTLYYVAIYGRNEGGGLAYGQAINVKTSDQPVVAVTRNSVSLTNNASAPYDLDGGKVVTSTDAQNDITFSWFSIAGRGTVLQLDATGGAIMKNLGVTNFEAVSYLNLINIPDFSNEAVSVLMNASGVNTVVGFETKEGRYGKLRLESANDNTLVISLVTYDK